MLKYSKYVSEPLRKEKCQMTFKMRAKVKGSSHKVKSETKRRRTQPSAQRDPGIAKVKAELTIRPWKSFSISRCYK